MTVELGKDLATGQQVLFVHALNVDEPDELVKKIKGGFERQILQITRGAV
jgi:multisubunit Na+/H+ antiporter MnhE subunit